MLFSESRAGLLAVPPGQLVSGGNFLKYCGFTCPSALLLRALVPWEAHHMRGDIPKGAFELRASECLQTSICASP